MDYYLNNAVYHDRGIPGKHRPYYDGEVDYGDRAEHCWNGDHTQPNAISRLRQCHRMFIPKWAEEVKGRGAGGRIWRLEVLKEWIYH